MSVVEPIFALFQVQVECSMRDAVELLQAPLSKAPEAFDAIDMCRASDKFIRAMIDSEVLRVADIDQAVIAAPPVTVDDGFGSYTTANNGLKCGLFAVGHDLRIDATVTLEDAEDDGLTRSSATAFAAHATRAEVAFIDFDFALGERRGPLTFFSDALSDFEKDHVDALACQSGQLSGSAGRQIEREMTQHSQEFTLANFGTPVIAV